MLRRTGSLPLASIQACPSCCSWASDISAHQGSGPLYENFLPDYCQSTDKRVRRRDFLPDIQKFRNLSSQHKLSPLPPPCVCVGGGGRNAAGTRWPGECWEGGLEWKRIPSASILFVLLNKQPFKISLIHCYSQPSISTGSISSDSTNHRSKIFEKKKSYVVVDVYVLCLYLTLKIFFLSFPIQQLVT